MLNFSFEELEDALFDIAASEAQKEMVSPIVSSLRKHLSASGNRLKTLDLLLAAAWLIQNEDADMKRVISESEALFKTH